MQMRSAIQIQSMLKAMTDVVLPAVDPGNKLAQEQAHLVMGMLALLAQQLPLQFRFDCDELARLIGLSRELQEAAGETGQIQVRLAELSKFTAAAQGVLDRARTGPEEVVNAVRDLRAASGAVISAVFTDGDASARTRVQQKVLAMSKEQLLRDRSFVLMQNWEPDPAAVPSIESLLST